MIPLKINFLWHQHQPYYKMEDKFILPWTRLHGVKDYFDLPEVLHEFPDIKQTFNLVPSLLTQIEDYISGSTIDRIQELTLIEASNLTDDEKKEILNYFFMCNKERMIDPFKRYKELYDRSRNTEKALRNFKNQDWTDLQVWYNLTWMGPFSRLNSAVKRLFSKGKDFTEYEKKIVLDEHNEILKRIIPQHKRLVELDQIEVSCSPFYHPIVPLLIDSMSGRESQPGLEMPDPIFMYPDDAEKHIETGIAFHKEKFGDKPIGMWPSEGSISNKALELFAKNDIKWVATDEEILFNSAKNISPTEKFFPHKFRTESGKEIAIFFRDHFLSDRIGFVYSQWNPWDAANEFTHHLKNIRNEIIKVHGDDALNYAVISVILDGENCWEYYQDNGVPFLRELYNRISEEREFKTVTCSEAIENIDKSPAKVLENIKAGSWINGNFSIWIGHEDDRKAWSMLGKARSEYENHKSNFSSEKQQEIEEALMIAEGSDWYWWYGPEHNAENKPDFDKLFRYYIRKVYQIMEVDVPEQVDIPITEQTTFEVLTLPTDNISPTIDGNISDAEWNKAGYYDARGAMSAMHQIGEVLKGFYFGCDDENIYFRIDSDINDKDNLIELIITFPIKLNISFSKNGCEIESDNTIDYFNYKKDKIIEIALNKNAFYENEPKEDIIIRASIRTVSNDNELIYPRQGEIEFKL